MSRQREHWGSKLGFILAAAGSAIGLGSLWKFPYVTGENGGGAFVLIYFLCTLFVCFPLFVAELIMGRATQKGPVAAFSTLSKGGNWKFIGWMALASTVVIFSYYSVVAGWTLNYLLLSLSLFTEGRTPDEIAAVFTTLSTSGDIQVLFQAIFILLTVGVVYAGVRQGIEQWARILMPALFIILVGLFIYSMTLSGFGEGVRFVLFPDTSRLTASGVLEALGLSFFTASLGFGIIITYGSYMRHDDNIPQTSLIVLVVTVCVSLLAALTIFPIIFTKGYEPAEGPGLVFVTLPILFAELPATLILSVAFFFLLIFTALTSTVSLLENLVANAMEMFGWSRHKSVWLAAGLVFVVGLPSALAGSGALFPTWIDMYGENFFGTLATVWDRWFLPLTGALTAIFVGWVVDKDVRDAEFLRGSSWRWFLRPWLFLIRWFVPIMVLIFILQASGIVDVDKWGF